jgi:hypothetical protein
MVFRGAQGVGESSYTNSLELSEIFAPFDF